MVIVKPDETVITRGKTPRNDGLFYQYFKMTNPLRSNFIFSDVLTPSDTWYTWKGQPIERVDTSKTTPENYHHGHNHYQNILSEVLNFTRGANAVPIWGDGFAAAHGANAWGGFMSARSACGEGGLMPRYVPPGLDRGCGEGFDAQLTGLEVDVLNGAKPGVFPNMAKHGVQVVGFGNPNSHALSVIVENFNREPEFQRGHFESILYAQSSLHPDYGRFMVTDFDKSMMGFDFRRTLFTQGAMVFRSEGAGTGIVVNNGHSGELYGDAQAHLNLRMGDAGFQLVSNDGSRTPLTVTSAGQTELRGDVRMSQDAQVAGNLLVSGNVQVSGEVLVNGKPAVTERGPSTRRLIAIGLAILLASVVVNVLVTRMMLARWARKFQPVA